MRSDHCITVYHSQPADENECEVGNPCSHACHNVVGTYYCSCPRGLSISADGRTCQGRKDQNTSHKICVNISIICRCCCLNNEIFFVPADIDECSLGESVCHDGQDCMNTIGSYQCMMRCGRGFRRTADGFSCTGTSSDFYLSIVVGVADSQLFFFFDNCLLCPSDVNECQESDPCNQICFNTIGSYRCACEPGFQLRNRRCIGEIFKLSDTLYVCVA